MIRILIIIVSIAQSVLADEIQITSIIEGEGAEIINHSKI